MIITADKSAFAPNDYRNRKFSGDWTKHYIDAYVDSIFNIGIDETQKIFAPYKREHLPENLYKFYPPTIYSFINLESQLLYMSSPCSFNDPFDSYMCIDTENYVKKYVLNELKQKKLITDDSNLESFTKQEYYELLNSWPSIADLQSNYRRRRENSFQALIYKFQSQKSEHFKWKLYEILSKARKDCMQKLHHLRNIEFKISSFSNFTDEAELMNNSTMWAHYSNNHYGFCVRYKIDFDKIENKNLILCGLFPVRYSAKVPLISTRELLKLKLDSNRVAVSKPILKTALKSMITKSRFWSYEKEWRLLIGTYNYETLSNNSLPFLKADAIYLGCRMDFSIKQHLIKYSETNDIQIFQTTQSLESYKLNCSEININKFNKEAFSDRLSEINNIEDKEERFQRFSILLDKQINK